jgi:hypothetical protein
MHTEVLHVHCREMSLSGDEDFGIFKELSA